MRRKNVRIFRKRVSPPRIYNLNGFDLEVVESENCQLILIEQVQRSATCFIVGKGGDLCYRDCLIKLKLLPLNYWLEYLDLVFFYNWTHNFWSTL